MATERQPPDAVLASTNLSNGLTEIDEDPDSPDGNWMVASENNVNTDVRTSFATPTGSPTVGAGLQEFKAWVRQFDEGQSGTPEVRIELWENGGLVRAGSNENVTTSGHMVTFPWNANELGTADGSLVECKIVGTKSGGGPSARNTVDVGAVEWNVTYSVGAITYYETLSAVSTTVPAVTAVITYVRTLAAISTTLPSLARVLTYVQSLSVVSAAIPGLSRIATFARTLSVVSATVPSLVKGMFRTLSVVSSTVPGLSSAYVAVRTLAATSTAVASLVVSFIAGVGRAATSRYRRFLH